MAKTAPKTVVHDDYGHVEMSESNYGPIILVAQVINYSGKKGEGDPGLNLQAMWTDQDGQLQYGKRPLLSLKALKWIRDNDLINKAIAKLESMSTE